MESHLLGLDGTCCLVLGRCCPHTCPHLLARTAPLRPTLAQPIRTCDSLGKCVLKVWPSVCSFSPADMRSQQRSHMLNEGQLWHSNLTMV